MKTTKKRNSSVITNRLMLTSLAMAFFLILFNSNTKAEKKTQQKNIKIALLLDTSNSMDGLIEQAKSQLWELVNELSKASCGALEPTLQIALYEYGNDHLSSAEGYIRQVSSLTSDLDQISEDLFSLTTNGGSEYCGEVIQTCINQQNWDAHSEDLQLIFIAGNEPFTQGNTDYRTACKNALEKGIIVNTIHCGSFDEGVRGKWKDGALQANGEFMCIEQNKKTVFIPSPYDEKINFLNKELNKTYLGYGARGESKKEAQIAQDLNAASYGHANAVKRAVSKSSKFYKNTSWDLVDAASEEDFEIETIEENTLPKEMQGLSTEEKKNFIQEHADKRAGIKKEIAALNIQREHYIKEKRMGVNNDESMLDVAMIKAIRNQANEKGFTFK